jgi:hypothetical protein
MADWRTYAKAARNTARRQAPGARDAARRATDRAGDYVRAAGRAVDEGWREDEQAPGVREDERATRVGDAPRERRERDEAREPRDREHEPTRDREPAGRDDDRREPRREREPREDDRREDARRDDEPRPATRARPSGEQIRREAAAYYAVASRRAERANIVPRVLRALRDALLIGLSLLVIWGVLAAAGIPIPFTTVLIAVGLIVALSFGTGLYGQWKRSRAALDEAEDPRDL